MTVITEQGSFKHIVDGAMANAANKQAEQGLAAIGTKNKEVAAAALRANGNPEGAEQVFPTKPKAGTRRRGHVPSRRR